MRESGQLSHKNALTTGTSGAAQFPGAPAISSIGSRCMATTTSVPSSNTASTIASQRSGTKKNTPRVVTAATSHKPQAGQQAESQRGARCAPF